MGKNYTKKQRLIYTLIEQKGLLCNELDKEEQSRYKSCSQSVKNLAEALHILRSWLSTNTLSNHLLRQFDDAIAAI